MIENLLIHSYTFGAMNAVFVLFNILRSETKLANASSIRYQNQKKEGKDENQREMIKSHHAEKQIFKIINEIISLCLSPTSSMQNAFFLSFF